MPAVALISIDGFSAALGSRRGRRARCGTRRARSDLHFLMVDAFQHEFGPGSPEAR
jgi:hypothetical protein